MTKWTPNPRVIKNIKEKLEKSLEKSIEVLESKVKSNAPVVTGRYKKSIKTEKSDDGMTQSLKVEVPYAVAVEYGKFGSAANPVVRSALAESKTKMLKQFKNILGK